MKPKTTIIFSQPEPTYPELDIDFTPAWDPSKRLRRKFPDIDIENPPPELKRKVGNWRWLLEGHAKTEPRLFLGHCTSYCEVDAAEAAQLRRKTKAPKHDIMCKYTTQELYAQNSDCLPLFHAKAFTYMQRCAEADDEAFRDPRLKRFWRRPYACEADGFEVCAVEVTREGRTFYYTGMQKRFFAPHVETTIARFRGQHEYLARLDKTLEPDTMPAVTEYRNSLKFTLCMMTDTRLGKWLRFNSGVKFSDAELDAELQWLLKLAETHPCLLDHIEMNRCLTWEEHLEWEAKPRFYQPGDQGHDV